MKKINKNNEKGIALVFTLAFISLLLIVALSFASESILEQKIAHYSSMGSTSNIMAQSALNRVMAILRYSHRDMAYDKNIDYFCSLAGTHSGTTDTAIVGSDSLLLKADTAINYDEDGFSFGTCDTSKVQWQYLTNGLTNNDLRLLGRIAYIAVPLNNRLDPSAMVDKTVNEALTTQTRPGVSPVEMYLGAVDTGGASMNSIIDNPGIAGGSVMTLTIARNLNMKYPIRGDTYGKLDDDKRWMNDWGNFFSQIITNDPLIPTNVSVDTAKQSIRQWFMLSDSRTPEAMWLQGDITTSPDKDTVKNDGTETFHRFQLNKTAAWWNSATVAGLCDTAIDDADNDKLEKYSNKSNNTGCIPWLANFGTDNNGEVAGIKKTFNNFKDRRRQIVANLIDYCDADGVPTSDVDPTIANDQPNSWGTATPKYTGNEKTPYINEMSLTFGGSVRVSSQVPWFIPAISDVKVQATALSGTLSVELIDIYGAFSANDDMKITVYGTVTPSISASTETKAGSAVTLNNAAYEIEFDGTGAAVVTNWANGYCWAVIDLTGLSSQTVTTNSFVWVTNANVSINLNMVVSIQKIILQYSDDGGTTYKNVDIALPSYSRTIKIHNNTSLAFGNAAVDQYGGVSLETFDPRQNLNSGDWETPTSKLLENKNKPVYCGRNVDVAVPGNYSGFFDMGYANSCVVSNPPSGGSDNEPGVSDPANGTLSTAYIRNAPMQSPWELGCIHRGAKWETINLKACKEDVSTSLKAGGSYYEDDSNIPPVQIGGDANILNQVKMTSDIETYGKVSLYNTNKDILRALFSYVYIHGDYSDPGDQSGFNINKSTLANIDTVLSQKVIDAFDNPTAPATRPKTRAALADVTEVTSSTIIVAATTDAKKEELIGKIINLTEATSSNTYLIIATAQSIKDVGIQSGISITKDGETKADVKNGIFDYQNGVYFDEITGESKIMAIVKQMSDGKWKILKYKVLSQ